MKALIYVTVLSLWLAAPRRATAQSFPKSNGSPWVWVEAGSGFNQPQGSPKLYLATLQIAPQYTVVPGLLRAGATGGGFYQGSQFGWLGGPRVTLKVLEGPRVLTASSYNIHLLGEYLFGTRSGAESSRQWLGGGVGLELDDLFGISLKLHRDQRQPVTYFQFGVSFNPTKPRIQPFTPVTE
ncbi:hypothetical protein [Telluribacter sp. SYSU D00476]|uniref:hypothetical protein n=1 Tax=Telluribacter sp. SYSU D00476 TaxID=2811430 RepID=UPI001FF6AEAD|nr:hypothetical protein [Telluribacter sp. SYSU D00476]